MSFVKGLKCRECGREYPAKPAGRLRRLLRSARSRLSLRCDCRSVLTRETHRLPPESIWRYRELLPLDADPSSVSSTGAPRWFAPTGWRASLVSTTCI